MRLCLYTYAVTLEINSLQNAGSPTGDSKGLCCSYFFRGIPLIVKFCYSVATNLSPKDAKWLSLESQSCGNFFFRNSSYGVFAAKSILLVKVRVNRDQCVGWTDCRGRVAVLPDSRRHHLLSAPPNTHTLRRRVWGDATVMGTFPSGPQKQSLPNVRKIRGSFHDGGCARDRFRLGHGHARTARPRRGCGQPLLPRMRTIVRRD